MKINKHIEIVRSNAAGLSSMGKKSCDMIARVLGQHYAHVGVSIVNGLSDLEGLVDKRPDVVFLGMKNLPVSGLGLDPTGRIWLAAYLESRGIDCTGSGGAAIMLDFDKPAAKQVAQAAGLNTSAYFLARPGQYSDAADLPLRFPLFVKPPNGGGGKGIGADSVVRDFESFTRKVAMITNDFHTAALVEEYLPGREFSVAILGDTYSDELTAMPIELITEQNNQGDRILSEVVKAADTEHTIAVHDTDIKRKVIELATDVFRALGARDYGRIDIRLDGLGTPYFLEANLIPGLANHDFISYFTSACRINQSMDYETMILSVVDLALSRHEIEDGYGFATSRAIFEPSFEP